ncbi:bifunctional [glutamate--ammonia ligase]-adenylyl-L-tyrosine phosphorylase/[glutamate--ammonia-ligase] adenylyltransferase [Alkalimarinus alittae]|uniref:Bifunctional glutamine synthetase adenylyltransferase/adenylyl-removing enzyme n=1 Tax=Alkalimarinus alittae TaxID=2961619 RepID=A0ABY6N0Z1_9ALTE|nr:bifunctional [glutamate--ammonia ligase]-adenylyl-L-tyrosine phosphorylase/[glutamate--ammonia-ligase] adenylyltransferase [Alkalimarinus alittae]UZE95765.1 bifunctional [glutamate--ammonia ligase]-adenylyl-L-tyrosine phosphorylase/[glutamate--ammonia-ligase] adenylyltransferase [Alkalimarinus alittae]
MIEQLRALISVQEPIFQEKLLLTLSNLEQSLVQLDSVDSKAWDTAVLTSIVSAWCLSDFVANATSRFPLLLSDLINSGDLFSSYDSGSINNRLAEEIKHVSTEDELVMTLRLFRRREMVRIIWRDLLKVSDLSETTRDMSRLADETIDQTLSWLHQDCCDKWGVPVGQSSGTPQQMVVLGMGKLGAFELNVSSDIDLIFAYPENGETAGAKRSIENQAFFIRLGQRLVSALDKTTADGLVFRTDMRLRPYGQSGSLALSFAAMEEYYQSQGREWERYAMIKARVVAGDFEQGQALMQSLKPFVYRRYIDFSVFQSLRDMKDMISREVRRKGMESNIKLGSGGIREVEFIVQAFQLIRGGRDTRLQQPELMAILQVLEEDGLLPPQAVKELREAYIFLRNIEHSIQGISDQQTQMLPESQIDQRRVALAMNFDNWELMFEKLSVHRQNVSRHFSDIIAPEEDRASEVYESKAFLGLWLGELSDEAAVETLQEYGFEAPDDSYRLLANLRKQRNVQMMQTQGRERLDSFIPLLLTEIASQKNRSLTLQRILLLIEAVLRRTAYFVLLNENPGALKQLVWLCSESPWIAEQLASTPLLLDELLNSESLYSPPKKEALQDELRQQLLRIPEEDFEEQMEVLRYFKKAHVLRVAASEVRGTLPLMKVSDYLTWIAEAELDQVIKIAWRHLTEKHGFPVKTDGSICDLDFAIIAYGKMGGIELGYTSDLDLVFLHSGDANKPTTGERSVDTGVFFTRLGQRIIHILNTQTAGGQIYEVDMRLRPSGNSGLLVCSLNAFEEYQKNNAWTWEHQALTRARFVAGSDSLGKDFYAVRSRILNQFRGLETLQQDVIVMREKMRDSLGSKAMDADQHKNFHIKHDSGGIIDIEFLCQFAVLGWSHKYPELMKWSDNIRILEEMGLCGLLQVNEAEKLSEIYKLMRSLIHKRALQKLNSEVSSEVFINERAFVASMWDKFVVRCQ